MTIEEQQPEDEMAALIKRNAEGLAYLDAANIDTETLQDRLLLSVLINLLLPNGAPLSDTFNAIYATSLAAHIEVGLKQVARDKLLAQ